MLRLAVALFAVQAGFHGFTASLPLALTRAGVPDPEIGLIVGTAAVVQLPAAFLAGALVDRFGSMRLFTVGAIAYLAGAGILLLPGVEPGVSPWPFVLARLFQGIGIAASLPSALSIVPRLVPVARRGFALAVVGSAHNLTLVILPPLSIAILGLTSLHGVAAAMVVLVIVGLVVARTVVVPDSPAAGLAATGADGSVDPLAGPAPQPARLGAASRRFGVAWRSSWLAPVLIVLLYVAHWGVVIAYLPARAEAAGADVGLLFAADGVAILLLRLPSGWLADRVEPRWLILTGLALTSVSIALLLLPPTTPILIAAGAITGAGGGILLTPLLVEISHRSDDADRGSAFALFSASLAGALVIGSIGAAPIVALAGFEAAILAAAVGLVLAAFVTLSDPGLARRGSA